MGSIRQSVQRKRSLFLAHYAKLCVVGRAAEATGIGRQTIYDWIEGSPDFKAAFDSARQGIVEKLELEAIRRAYDGWDEPVFYKGEQQGLIRKYSDTLLIFLLKGAAPDKYRERFEGQVTGEGGGAVLLRVIYEPRKEAVA